MSTPEHHNPANELLAQFTAECERFDWFHEMSDDHSVWRRGENAWASLMSEARAKGDDFKRVLNAAHAKRYNRKPFVGPYDRYVPFPEVWSEESKP